MKTKKQNRDRQRAATALRNAGLASGSRADGAAPVFGGPSSTDGTARTQGVRDLSEADRRKRHLAQVFAREPELISACLESVDQGSPVPAKLILDAARIALITYPHYADLQCHAGHAAIAAREYEAATRMLEQALHINPTYKDALLLAARVALLRQLPQEAKRLLRRALSQGADYPDVHMLLGSVWCQEGNWERARESYERALELNGNLTAVRAALAALPPTGMSGKNDELPA